MIPRRVRRLLAPLVSTPLHPQWLIRGLGDRELERACRDAKGVALDIGCASRRPLRFLSPQVRYLGLDYLPTARDWYALRPDVYGDAQRLPLADGSVHQAFLLDVLEHLPEPDVALQEAYRVLEPSGRLIVQVPFLYPLHDQPLDFHRWTRHGLQRLAERHGFEVLELQALGSPVQCAGLLGSLAWSHWALESLRRRALPTLVLLPLLPVVVLIGNLTGALGRLLQRSPEAGEFMPLGYHLVLQKP